MGPLLAEKVYGAVPAEGVTITDPLFTPGQLALVLVAVPAKLPVIPTNFVSILLQTPEASETEIVYVPVPSPVNNPVELVIPPGFKVYVYGSVPPEAVIVMLPTVAPQVVFTDEAEAGMAFLKTLTVSRL